MATARLMKRKPKEPAVDAEGKAGGPGLVAKPGPVATPRRVAAKSPAKRVASKRKGETQDLPEVAGTGLQEGIPGGDSSHEVKLTEAFHHLQRAGALISLLEEDESTDLRDLLGHGIKLYRKACGKKRRRQSVECAFGLLRAAEHLSMAGLYESRSEARVEVAPPPKSAVEAHLHDLAPRLDKLGPMERANARRLEGIARHLLERAKAAGHDPHLEYELTMAADGICLALEEGL